MSSVPVVEMKGMTKRFPGVLANDHVDFDLAAGEVHALLGENGAGKTTLMNMLYGMYSADEGEVRVRGRIVKISSPKDSIALGVSMVHQQFELVNTLTVSENVALGLKASREPILDLGAVSRRVKELSEKYGLRVSHDATIQLLSVGERQRVEIIKALYRDSAILIMDEPTSVLNPDETEELFTLLRSMAKEGRSVVVITHKLPEVMAVSDRVTVLRKGKVAGRFKTGETSPSELAIAMVGHDVSAGANAPQSAGPVLLEVKDLQAKNDKGAMGLNGLSLSLSSGEIVGIAGVAGNGQSELVDVLTGLRSTRSGSLLVRGVDVTNGSPNDMMKAGIGVVPEDRKGSGLIMEFSIADNLVLEKRGSKPFSDRGLMKDSEIRAYAQAVAKEYSIATPDVSLPAYTLSGGNLQRLLLAKVLSRNPSILVAAQPTAGLDVGATQFIWEKLRSERSKGVGILLVSSDLSEILTLSDRVACIYNGAIVGTMSRADANMKKIGLMMGGANA